TGFSCAADPPGGAIGMVLHTMTLLVARQLTTDVAWLADTAEIAIVPPLCPLPVSAYDFSQAAALEARAADATAAWIAHGGLESRTIPTTLHPHHH
ncbi:MAG: patatin-like phospholipase family protein, partial [Gemmatimonadota bacterium]|nr:patatin-like phospholipase family protein [Gemmatimonadota bacterium]